MCFASPGEGGGGVSLRARTRCCGREFCAECLAKSIVCRADMGLPPSCPQCRDGLGACLEVCDPLVVRRRGGGHETTVGQEGKLRRALPFDQTLRGVLREALERPVSRVLVVASPSDFRSLLRCPMFLRACVDGGSRGFEVLRGSSGGAAARLYRFASGSTRVMLVEGGQRKEFGVKMPWVTHVVMLDSHCRSSHWVSRTGASCSRSAVGEGSARGDSGSRSVVTVRRIVPAKQLIGRSVAGGGG